MLPGFMVKRKAYCFLLVLLMVLVLAAVACAAAVLSKKTFYQGISVEETDVSGMSLPQASLAVSKALDEKYGKKPISFVFRDRIWSVNPPDIGLRFRLEEALERAYAIGRQGNVFQRLYRIARLRRDRVNVEVLPDFDGKKLTDILKAIADEIRVKEVDASVNYKDGAFTINKETVGAQMDIDINRLLVENCIREKNFDRILLYVEEIKPRVLYEDIREIDGIIAGFSTVFNTGDRNRSHNIRLACERINNTILLADDIFSMNRALGPRTLENGYKEAPVIYKNEYVQGPGGGVCQVTTTLYVAVLKAGLEVIERSSHSLPLGYVEPGQDATIAEGSIDLKFQNRSECVNGGYAVFIAAETKGNRINISIYGKKREDSPVIKLKSQILEVYPPGDEEILIDDSVPDNEKQYVRQAKQGMKVAVYREVYSMEGALLKREKISEDIYRPIKAQVKVNSNYLNVTDHDGNGVP